MARTDKDFYLAEVMNYKLGGSFSGNVNLILREEKGYTYGARTGFNGSKIKGTFKASSSVRTNTTGESVSIFKEEIADYKNGVSQEDLDFTKNAMIKSNARRFETQFSLLGMLQEMSTYNLPADYIAEEEDFISAMTLEQHKQLANKYLDETKMAVSQGFVEITLLGQNVNSYQGDMDDGDTADLALLIHYVAAIEGIDRIRFTTSHPVEFSESLIDAFAEIPELVDHVHLPIQSGSDRILAMMKRGHTALEYKAKLRRLQEVRPNISLSSDFIIGFPDESDADFQATLDLVKEMNFDHSFSFIYSARPGTPAAAFIDSVTDEVKKSRLKRIQEALLEQEAAHSQAMLGSTQRILVERVAERVEGELKGRTENNRSVVFEGDESLIGKFVDVTVTEAYSNSLRAEMPADSIIF